MDRYRSLIALLSGLAFLFAAGPATMAADQSLYLRPLEPTNPSFKRKTIFWQSSGYDGKTTIAHGVEPRDGKVAVCGLHLSLDRYPRAELKRILKEGRIVSGRDVLMIGLEYFREFKAPDRVLLRCKRTDIPWKAKYGRQVTNMQMLLCTSPDNCAYK